MNTLDITPVILAMVAIIPGIFALIQQLKKEKETENLRLSIERYKLDAVKREYLEESLENNTRAVLENNTNKICKYCKTRAEIHEKTCEKCGAPL